MAKLHRVLYTWAVAESKPLHIKFRWVEVALDGWHNDANGIWRVTDGELRQACEWYLDQGDARRAPYTGLAEAFLDEHPEQSA